VNPSCLFTTAARVARGLVALVLLAGLLAVPAGAAPASVRPWEGTLDLSFNPGTGTYDAGSETTGTVNAIVVQPDGKILIAGNFIKYRGVTRKGIARVNSDGTLDTTFVPQTADWNGHTVNAMVLQSDGKIIIGGSFPTYSTASRNGIARIYANGTLDTTFNPGTGFDGNVLSLALLPGNKVLAGGDFTTFNGSTRNYVAVLSSTGVLDTTFDPSAHSANPNDRVHSVAYQPSDGKVLIGGYFTRVGTTTRYHLARLNTNGALDGTFDPGTLGGYYSIVYAIYVQPDGKIVVGGNFETFQGVDPMMGVARVNANGLLDPTFTTDGGGGSVLAIVPDHFGRLLIGGEF